jgi:curli biogenesis system outer membrane secretion channel CsgG
MMIQQSNCFVVVERGAAMQNMQAERSLRDSGEMRQGSNMGAGQMVAAREVGLREGRLQALEHGALRLGRR